MNFLGSVLKLAITGGKAFLGNWQMYLIIAGIISAVGFGTYLYVGWLKAEKENLVLQIQKAEKDLLEQKKVTDAFKTQLETEIKKINQIQTDVQALSEADQARQADVAKLRQTLAKHDLNKLSTAKPKLVEKIINKASNQAIKDLNKIGASE